MNIVQFPKLGLEFTFKNQVMIGSFGIAYYGILITIGLVLAVVYAYYQFPKVGVDRDKAIDVIICGMIGGALGARIYYVAFSWENYGLDFSNGSAFWSSIYKIINIRDGGLAIYGGLIGALLVGCLIAKWRKVKIKPLLDVAGVGFLIGQSIGRWGNFFNVEAFGSNTNMPWGMTGPAIKSYLSSKVEYFAQQGITIDPMTPVHPCFLYESIWCLIGFILLALYMKHRKFDGEVFLMYLGYYGLGRFIIEGFRTDSLMMFNFRVSQMLALVLFIVSVIIIIIVRIKIKNSNDENYMKLYAETEEGIAILNESKLSKEKKHNKEKLTKDQHILDIENENTKIEEENKENGSNN